MEELSTDILVIGSGLAGIVSAIEAEESGLQVLIVGKFSIGMGTNTSMANGAFTAANSRFSKEDHLQTTLCRSGAKVLHFHALPSLPQRGQVIG